MMIELLFAAALPLQVPSAPWLNGGKAPDAPENVVAGNDWMNDSGLRCGCYDPNGNMLLNPSFESGRRYWTSCESGVVIDDLIVTNCARSGAHSLWLKPWKFSAASCLVVDTNTDYVASFYVRAEHDTQLSVSGFGIQWQRNPNQNLPVKGDGEWHRVEYKFHSGPLQREMLLKFRAGPNEAWVDDIQLERGTEATPYRGNPFALEIVLDSPERTYCDARKDSKPRIRLAGPLGAKGKLRVSVTDIFQRKVFTAAKRFTLGKTGEVFLPLDDATLPKGTLVATVRVEPLAERAAPLQGENAGGRLAPRADMSVPFIDYLRWTKIDYLDNTQKNKNMMLRPSLEGHVHDGTMQEWQCRRMAHFGFGGYVYGAPESFADKEMLERYRIETFHGGWCTGSQVLRKVMINDKPYEWEGVNVYNVSNYPPAFLQWIEDNVAEAVAKKEKVNNRFSLDTEPLGHHTVLKQFDLHARDEYAKCILANWRGLKRARPDATLIPYGAWNMFQQGREDITDMLKRLKRLDPKASDYFDTIEVHSYRSRPIVEDDLLAFYDQLDKAGYPKMKILIGEGNYYYPMWRQSYWIQRGCGPKDEYQHLPLPSYDLGWGERFASMCVVREALWYYRHAERVKGSCSWNPAWIDKTEPIAWAAANNAMANLLGNATFVEDVRFATDARGLVFDDGKGSTVAAVWREDAQFDDGKVSGTTMEMANVKGMDILDLMGNKCEVEKRGGGGQRIELPLSGFVVYLRVKNAKRGELLKALRGAKSAADRNQFPLKVNFAVADTKTGAIDLTNPLSHDCMVEVTSGAMVRKLTVRGGTEEKVSVSLPFEAKAELARQYVVPVTVKVKDGPEKTVAFTNALAAIPYAASPVDWSKVPTLKNPKQMSTWWVGSGGRFAFYAEIRRCWNEKGLHFQIDVTDAKAPIYCPEGEYVGFRGEIFHGIRTRFVFDGFGDAQRRRWAGLGNYYAWDDFGYDLIPLSEKKAICWRFLAPDQQLAGGVDAHPAGVEPDIPVKFKVRSGGYSYEVTLPAELVLPVALKEGTVFGLSVEPHGLMDAKENIPSMWVDETISIYTAHMQPWLVPQMILVK